MRLVGWTPDDEQGSSRAAVRHDAKRRRRRLLRRSRRPLLALLVGTAAVAVLLALRPPDTATAAVVTAGSDLPAGHALASSDLTTTLLPASLVPATAVAGRDAGQLVGGVLSAPLGRGELVTTVRTLGPGLLHGAPGGTLAVPVSLAGALPDGAVRAGDTVAVIVAAPDRPLPGPDGPPPVPDGSAVPAPAPGSAAPPAPRRAGLLVDRAVVLMPPPPAAAGALTGAAGPPVAVLALSAEQAQAVADAGAEQPLTLGVVAAR